MLMGMEGCMMAFYEDPEATHALLEYITDYELHFAEIACEHLPMLEAIFHHDDWGSQRQTFMSPTM